MANACVFSVIVYAFLYHLSAVDAAEESFSKLLGLNSQSLAVLRLYSEFTLYVCSNQSKVGH
jgi:hypothetical protein